MPIIERKGIAFNNIRISSYFEINLLFLWSIGIASAVASISLMQSYLHYESREIHFPLMQSFIVSFGSHYLFLPVLFIVRWMKVKFDITLDYRYLGHHIFAALVTSLAMLVLISTFQQLIINNEVSVWIRIKYHFHNNFSLLLIGYALFTSFSFLFDFYFKNGSGEESKDETNGKDIPNPIHYLTLKVNGKWLKIETAEITFCESYDNYVKVHTRKEIFVVRHTLKDLVERLDKNQFKRIHRSYIVNTSYIKEWFPLPHGNVMLLLKTGHQLRMSKSYKGRLQPLIHHLA